MEVEILEITALYAVLVPGAVTGFALLLVPERLAALAVTVGYWAGYYGVQGWPQFPPVESTEWLPWFVLVMAAVCVLRIPNGLHRRLSWLVVFIVLTVAFLLLLSPAFKYSWGLAEGLGWLSILVAAACFFWFGFIFKVERSQRSAPAVVFLIVAGGEAFIAGVSGSVVLSQLAAIQAATLGAGVIVSLWRRGSWLEGSGLLHLVLLSGIVASGWYFVEASAYSALTLMAVPWLALQATRRALEKWPVWASLLTVAAVSLITVSLACYIAVLASPPLDMEMY